MRPSHYFSLSTRSHVCCESQHICKIDLLLYKVSGEGDGHSGHRSVVVDSESGKVSGFMPHTLQLAYVHIYVHKVR